MKTLATRQHVFEPPNPDAATWRVRVLGTFALDDGRQRLTRLRSRAAMALVARLAMAPRRDHGREELSALLWPDVDETTGRTRLRQTLSLLRSVLEPPGGPLTIQADRRVLRCVPGAFWCDASAFEAAVKSGAAEQALATYQGELMPGFYDEWIVDERERLQALADRLPEGGGLAPAAAAGGAAADAAVGATVAAMPAASGEVRVPPSVAGPSPRLPHYLTRLIGADQQGARLQALVHEHRLVTVLGAGGVGKTRLAIEVARASGEVTPGASPPAFERTVFVSLVAATTAGDLVDRMALALRVQAAADLVAAVIEVLDTRCVLMLLDNADQLDADASRTLAHLAEQLPSVHWLLTSRRPLDLEGERCFALAGLEMPARGASLAEVTMSAAVALFIERARAHRPDFHVTRHNLAALVDLVRWLEGLPLAIELAASHARALGPAEMLELLSSARHKPTTAGGSGLALLSRRGPRSGSDPRHASMVEVVSWSWRLLTATQQALLMGLCILPAGATLQMAGALMGCGSADEASDPAAAQATGLPAHASLAVTQILLDELCAQSVLRFGLGQDGQARYAPLEPIREFVLASVDDRTQLRPLRRRARRALMAWARAMPATPMLPGVREEMPNLRLAVESAASDGDGDDALELALLLQSSWGEMSMPASVLDSLDRLLEAPGLDDSRAAGVHALAAWACQEAGRPDEARRHRDAALARPCPDPAIRAMVLSRSARTTWRIDKDHLRARSLIEQAMPLARAAQRDNTVASLLSLQGHLATVVDADPVRGKALSAQALALWALSGNRHLVNNGRYNVAVQTMEAGHPEQALAEFEALAREGRELQDWDLVAGAHEAHGTAMLKLRRWARSAASLRESLHVAWEGLEVQAALYALWNIPPALARLRKAELAAQTMGCAEAQWLKRFGAMDRRDRRDLTRMRRFARQLLGPRAAADAWHAGAARPLGEAVHLVLDTLEPRPSDATP